MIRSRILVAASAAVALALALAGAARADGLFGFGGGQAASTQASLQDRLLAKAAFTTVLERRSGVLGMTAPLNLAAYAPIYPDGFIVSESLAVGSPTGGMVHYAAAAPLQAVLAFYEDAAALAHLPFQVTAQGPDALVLQAGDGRRKVHAVLTRQFKESTVVYLTYG
jgi:hypothetical protein